MASRFGIEWAFWEVGTSSNRIGLSKIDDYLTDNVRLTRLSDVEACGQ